MRVVMFYFPSYSCGIANAFVDTMRLLYTMHAVYAIVPNASTLSLEIQ